MPKIATNFIPKFGFLEIKTNICNRQLIIQTPTSDKWDVKKSNRRFFREMKSEAFRRNFSFFCKFEKFGTVWHTFCTV